jgi:hypothetical protein
MASPNRTGTDAEKRRYVEKRMDLIAEKILGFEEQLDKLAGIVPERRKDLEEIASYLDHGVGRIYGTLKRWEDAENKRVVEEAGY